MDVLCVGFFFSRRRRHTRLVSDWSSDVCSSDLVRRGRCTRRPRETSSEYWFHSSSDHRPRRTRDRDRSWESHGEMRSEERRVGKEWRCRWGEYEKKKKDQDGGWGGESWEEAGR